MADINKTVYTFLTLGDNQSYRDNSPVINDVVSGSSSVNISVFQPSGVALTDTINLDISSSGTISADNTIDASGVINLFGGSDTDYNTSDIIIEASGNVNLFGSVSGYRSTISESVVNSEDVVILSGAGAEKNEDGSIHTVFRLIDEPSYHIRATVDVDSIRGTYNSRVFFDINSSGNIIVSAEYLYRGRWLECTLEQSIFGAGEHTVIWNADADITENITTKLRISTNNMLTYRESTPFNVDIERLLDQKIPLLVLDNWNLPASGNPPSGYLTCISAGGYNPESIVLRLGQYLNDGIDDFSTEHNITASGIKSFCVDTYYEWGKFDGLFDKDKYPGSICTYAQKEEVVYSRPDDINRKVENLLAWDGYSSSHAYNHQDFLDKSYPNGPVHVANVNGSGGSVVTGWGDNFCQKFAGYVFAPEDGTYTFATNSDDASDLSVDGNVICSWYGGHGTGSWRTGTVALTTGWHEFVYYQEEGGGGQAWYAGWQKPSDSGISIIPESNLAGSLLPLEWTVIEDIYYPGSAKHLFDAEESVMWGQYILDANMSSAVLEFRAYDSIPIPSGVQWVQPSGSYIFPQPSGGRYLECRFSLQDQYDKIDRFAIFTERNKFIYRNEMSSTVDAGNDVQWEFIEAWGDYGEIQYRYATDAEGIASLDSKPWEALDTQWNISKIYARYIEWKTDKTADTVILMHGDSYRNYFALNPIGDTKQGLLDVQYQVYDISHTDGYAARCKYDALMLDDNIPYTSVWPTFVWNNSYDTDGDTLLYELQIVREDDFESIDVVDINTFSTDSDFMNYYSKTDAVVIEDDSISIDTSINDTGEIIYRIGDGSSRVWTDLIFDAEHDKTNYAYNVIYLMRTSDNQTDWTSWTEVSDTDKYALKSCYIEIKIKFIVYSGNEKAYINRIDLYSIDGEYTHIIEEANGETTSYSITDTPLEVNKYYYFRVRAFDGINYSLWSRMSVIYTFELGVPYAPTDLQTDGMTEPVHVIHFTPYFSWQFNDNPIPASGLQQHARVQVGSASGVWDIWDSGKLPTSSGIVYAQPSGAGATNPVSLVRGKDYYWRARTWDDSAQNLAGPFSEATTFRINRLPTVPRPLKATD